MNTKMATRGLGALFCIFAIFLASRLIFSKPSGPKPVSEAPLTHRPPNVAKRETKGDTPRKVTIQADKPNEQEARSLVKASGTTRADATDPDEAFMKGIASLPLDQANLALRTEVERRIQTNEKERAKLIFSENKNGKAIVAYAVKQPSLQEISKMLKLYQMLLERQTAPNGRDYVNQRYQYLVDSYAMTDGRYRLLYATIPETAGGEPIRQYSYAASSEQECLEILKQELSPKPPMVIGVTYAGRQGQSSSIFALSSTGWRMDQLVSEELTKPFYR